MPLDAPGAHGRIIGCSDDGRLLGRRTCHTSSGIILRYDPDELEEEQRERQLRKRMNAEFQNFAKSAAHASHTLDAHADAYHHPGVTIFLTGLRCVAEIEEQSGDIEFDIPYRELGFYGVPPHNKSTCYVMPAVNALVELTEPPWFVVPLNDIEARARTQPLEPVPSVTERAACDFGCEQVASFERVVYGLKNFDLTLVMKDFSVKPVQVSAINVEHLDSLKTWLDNCNIKFYEGTANLNWGQIIKHITAMGLQDFYDEGGWKNVLGMGEGSGEESGDDAEVSSGLSR